MAANGPNRVSQLKAMFEKDDPALQTATRRRVNDTSADAGLGQGRVSNNPAITTAYPADTTLTAVDFGLTEAEYAEQISALRSFGL